MVILSLFLILVFVVVVIIIVVVRRPRGPVWYGKPPEFQALADLPSVRLQHMFERSREGPRLDEVAPLAASTLQGPEDHLPSLRPWQDFFHQNFIDDHASIIQGKNVRALGAVEIETDWAPSCSFQLFVSIVHLFQTEQKKICICHIPSHATSELFLA
jgi:hypothetical protein